MAKWNDWKNRTQNKWANVKPKPRPVVRNTNFQQERIAQNTNADRQTADIYLNEYLEPRGMSWNTPGAGTGFGRGGAAAAIRTLSAGGATPATPSYGGGGGGGGWGGGGGGGGGSAMTQAMFDAMLKAIGAAGPQLDLPDFQGQKLAAFNAAPYTQALGQINTAVTADQAASTAASAQADKALRANYSNAYANAPVAQAPVAQQVGTALQQTAGGGGDQAAVAAQSNQAAQSDQASFANLLNVLAAADQSAQASRLNQVALDRGTATRGINAQALGLRGGVNAQQAQAQNQWQQAAAERDYQNSLMRQQWQREEDQGNWQQRNEMISNRLTPLLQLLQSSGSKVNTDALTQLLAQWGAK